MTYEEREAIFSKEILSQDDLMALFNCCRGTAVQKMRYIKSKSDRVGLQGVCHIQDYIDAYNLDIRRFLMPKKERPYEEKEEQRCDT